jgi:hypothetical protein
MKNILLSLSEMDRNPTRSGRRTITYVVIKYKRTGKPDK